MPEVVIHAADFPEGFRVGVELRGIDIGRGRQPQSEKQEVDRAALAGMLQCLLSDFGFVNAPPEGCAPRNGDLDLDRVTQITERVLQQLREKRVL
jgi:4-hydroxy-tetrahydrodipicolinate synthase